MIYAAVPLVVLALCLFLGQRVLALLLILAYLAFEGFLKLVSDYHPIVHIGIDIVVLGTVGAAIAQSILSRRLGLRRLPWTIVIVLYMAWVVMEVFNPLGAGLFVGIAALKVHLAMVPLYFFTAAVIRSKADANKLLAGLVLLGCIPTTVALFQYALGPDSILDLSARARATAALFHEWRPFGLGVTPGGASVPAFLLTPLAIALVIAPGSTRQRQLGLLGIVLAAATFVVSGVRQLFLGAVLATFVTVALLQGRRRGRAIGVLLLTLCLGLGAYVAVQTWLRPIAMESLRQTENIPEIWRERDITTRLLTLQDPMEWAQARGNPIAAITARIQRYPFGAGLGRTGSAAGRFAGQLSATAEGARIQAEVGFSDNFFADMITETGLPGVVLLTTVLLGFLVLAVRGARHLSDVRLAALSAAAAGVMSAIFGMSYGSQPLLANPITAYFWVLGGVIARLPELDEAAEAEREKAAGPAAAPELIPTRA